jgi:flagellar motor switch protein FliG
MGKERDLVITAYGHDKVIDTISVSAFERGGNYDDRGSNATTYCGNINALELKGNSWVYATIVSENAQYALDAFIPLKFDVLLKLDDAAVQKVLREIDSIDLARALKNAPDAIHEKIFRNMSKRAVQMIKEDMECMGILKKACVKESQEKIAGVIRRLAESGEIIIQYLEGDTVL